jgi:uncharacterized glyoxalase superfamily protein PhnB
MTDPPEPAVWPVLHYDDVERAVRFLVDAFGFREALAVRDDDGDVIHAELRWPAGGAVVVGGTKHTGGVHGGLRAGATASYVVADDLDTVYERARRARMEIVEQPHETQFGAGVPTRAFTARDPEGNLWTFGTYRGAP